MCLTLNYTCNFNFIHLLVTLMVCLKANVLLRTIKYYVISWIKKDVFLYFVAMIFRQYLHVNDCDVTASKASNFVINVFLFLCRPFIPR